MSYVAFETEEEQSAYWRLMGSLLGGDDDDSPSDERGFCPTGKGGGVDNSCGGKGGGGKSGSTGGRKGGRKKPDRVPTRRPSKAERALAASDGTSDKHVAARKVVAAHYTHSQGAYFDRRTEELKPLDEDRFRGQMRAIDWTKPVTAGPPPSMPPPQEFVQWQTPGLIPPAGGYFSTPGTEPERLGIGSKGTLWTDPALPTLDKVPHLFSVAGAPNYLRSTAAPAVDTWSQKGVIQQASGGGPQWFVPEAQAKGGVKQLKFKGARPRRSDRADAPAPKKDQIVGSDKNAKGSAAGKSGDIELKESTITALKTKASEHNAKMKKRDRPAWTRVRVASLKAVYRRGAGAFSVSHRPGMTRDQWAMARVNAFLTLASRGRPENAKYVGDNDLLHRDHPKYSQARAFCPGASPPDNSCSPSNKGDGKSAGTKKVASPKKAKKSPVEKQMDMMRQYVERFDGSSLARPRIIMGMPEFHVDPVKFSKYLESNGQEWKPGRLPPGVPRGVPQECYSNATQLVLQNKNLDYVEGIAYPQGLGGMGFLHGWAVDRETGRVVDNTWDTPENAKYFGVRYDRKEYMRHVARTKYFGVVGGDPKAAARVIKKGKL